MAKILCTGSRGFICAKLVERLKQEGHEVSGFDILDGQDLRSMSDVSNAIRGKDVVFHLAAVADLNRSRAYPLETMEINLKGTWNIAKVCSDLGAKLYFASTLCRFGNQKVHPATEESLPNPSEIYACSKVAGENIIKGFHHTYGLEYNLMCFATIYGEGTRTALGTHIFMGQALRGEPITVHGDGEQTRTLTHIDDLIEAIISLYKSNKMNDIWNMSATEEISANKMAHDIKRLTRSKSPIIHIPQRIGQTTKESISADKMYKETGWYAKVSWYEGIGRMYRWFKETNQINNLYDEPK